MAHVTVVLSQQDLSDFLDGNLEYMDAYTDELQKRLTEYFGSASVDIVLDALTDKIDIDGESDDGTVAHIMNQMVNDWDWLPE